MFAEPPLVEKRDRHVLRPGVGDELAGEDGLGPDVVGDGRDVGRLGGERDRRHGLQVRRRVHAVGDQVVGVRGRPAVAEGDDLAAPTQPLRDGRGRRRDGFRLRAGRRGPQAS